ncbi:hypothetical protein K7432_009868 [Basidiobolus ranarum]|uniref:Uncharacterized protein n=1 Tax=Basidiobolus ranarum TaxID=34480 RepID=A0ABR2VWE7_9FUNG
MAKHVDVALPSYEATTSLPSTVCCISINESDKIRLIGTPKDMRISFRDMLKRSWSQGIQDDRDYYEQPEFKLFGRPWHGQGDESVPSRVLLVEILRYMEQQGWRYLAAADISKKHSDKDTLFFEYTGVVCSPVIFSISFNQSDRLRIICAPPEIQDAIRAVVRNCWRIQHERRYNGSWEFKLLGDPWFADGRETIRARVLLVNILAAIRAMGYKMYASINISGGDQGDLDSWFFRERSD